MNLLNLPPELLSLCFNNLTDPRLINLSRLSSPDMCKNITNNITTIKYIENLNEIYPNIYSSYKFKIPIQYILLFPNLKKVKPLVTCNNLNDLYNIINLKFLENITIRFEFITNMNECSNVSDLIYIFYDLLFKYHSQNNHIISNFTIIFYINNSFYTLSKTFNGISFDFVPVLNRYLMNLYNLLNNYNQLTYISEITIMDDISSKPYIDFFNGLPKLRTLYYTSSIYRCFNILQYGNLDSFNFNMDLDNVDYSSYDTINNLYIEYKQIHIKNSSIDNKKFNFFVPLVFRDIDNDLNLYDNILKPFKNINTLSLFFNISTSINTNIIKVLKFFISKYKIVFFTIYHDDLSDTIKENINTEIFNYNSSIKIYYIPYYIPIEEEEEEEEEDYDY